MEPRAATPERRLDAIRQLTQAGCPTVVMVAPIVPGLNDHEIEAVLERAAEAGASAAGYVVLRLPLEIKDLFREWLEAEHPDRARRVISLVRQMRGGRDYDPEWTKRQLGQGPLADLIAQRFRRTTEKLGMTERWEALDATQFRRPEKAGDQLALL
jgi:DNA repair photolyase